MKTSPPSSDLTPNQPNPNPFPIREGAKDFPSHPGKGPRVRSSGVRSAPIFGQKVDPVKLARAQELRREMTEAERLLWRALRTNQLRGFHFRRQQVIDGFIADFYCHDAGLVIEVDGPSHKALADYDAERDAVLTARGLRVIRIANEEVLKALEAVLTRIAKDLTPNPFPTREGAEDRANFPSHTGKGPRVRSSPIFGQNIDPVKLARAQELRRGMTEAERLLWRALRTNQLRGFHFRRQQVIDGFIADFYCHDAGLVIEVDGPSHKALADYDAERDAVLTARGLRVIRIANEEVLKALEAVLTRIAKDLTPNPFPTREGAEDRAVFPSHLGKGPRVRSPGVRS